MYRELKPMLTPSELIEHLETKGVKFELINRENAKKYLEENNNYFKLVSYRKNFPKYQNGENYGKYIGLDFKMLMDLSIIDMRIGNKVNFDKNVITLPHMDVNGVISLLVELK